MKTWNYSRLRGQIREKFNTQRSFSDAMGMNPATLSGKLNSKAMFSQDEIQKAAELLGIEAADLASYFFSKESCDNTTSLT